MAWDNGVQDRACRPRAAARRFQTRLADSPAREAAEILEAGQESLLGIQQCFIITMESGTICAVGLWSFSSLQLSSQRPLHDTVRKLCASCNRQRAFLCQDCATALTDGVPSLSLPVKVRLRVSAYYTGGIATLYKPIMRNH